MHRRCSEDERCDESRRPARSFHRASGAAARRSRAMRISAENHADQDPHRSDRKRDQHRSDHASERRQQREQHESVAFEQRPNHFERGLLVRAGLGAQRVTQQIARTDAQEIAVLDCASKDSGSHAERADREPAGLRALREQPPGRGTEEGIVREIVADRVEPLAES